MLLKINSENLNNLLNYFKENHRGNNPLYRNMMTKDELAVAEKLFKSGNLFKGTDPKDNRLKFYYWDGKQSEM